MFLLVVAMLAPAGDGAVALRCPAALERQVLRPYPQVTGGEVSDALLAVVSDIYEPENGGCTAWGECTTVDCALPDGSALDL